MSSERHTKEEIQDWLDSMDEIRAWIDSMKERNEALELTVRSLKKTVQTYRKVNEAQRQEPALVRCELSPPDHRKGYWSWYCTNHGIDAVQINREKEYEIVSKSYVCPITDPLRAHWATRKKIQQLTMQLDTAQERIKKLISERDKAIRDGEKKS